MSTDIKVNLFREELCIAFLFLIFFCKLVDSDSLIDRAGLIIGMKKKTIPEFYQISWVWLDSISLNSFVDSKLYSLSSLLLVFLRFDKLFT